MDFEKILSYYLGELSGEEKETVENFLLGQPYHFEVLGGLSKIESELKSGEQLRDFLERKKVLIYKSVFKK